MLRNLLKSMRPKQWTKNVFVFMGIVFSRQLLDTAAIAKSLLAFLFFCMASSATYLINDLIDIERDRAHPVKRNRPLAAGQLHPSVAVIVAGLLVVVAGGLSFWLSISFAVVLLIYFGLMLAYSFCLKNIVILDVFTIAMGFVLRAAGGALALQVAVSPWLLICTILLALFMGLAKRRHELIMLEDNASEHRVILQEYSASLLEAMISVVAASTVMAYSLYTVFAVNLPREPYPYMMITIPFFIYAIFRYLYLVYQQDGGGSPEEILLKDLPFLIDLLLWGAAVFAILYIFNSG